ncbi:outer membrane protein transport protein [Myxococcota bacterium]|nr:outer membrane protein transport protein [Myxococcota bacterium]MBU1382435.1 outer membrane protein transport protein [Myxococcota bacterium]MBU1496776.1 outer membrane protein transport protein [Myxococcota bacterium]
MKNLLIFSLFLFTIICSTQSRANPSDIFGLDPASRGTAQASSLINPELWSAAVHNPAALAGLKGVTAGASWGYGYMNLNVNGRNPGILDAHGSDLGLATSIGKIFGIPISIGTAFHLPDQMIVRLQAIPASEARFIMLDNYPHRLEAAMSAAAAVTDWMKVGFGINVMMDLIGRSLHLNVGSKGGNKTSEMEIDANLPYKYVPFAGILIDRPPWLKPLRFALFFRDQYSFRLKMNILADVDVAGIVTGDAIIALKMYDHFSPRKISASASWDFGKNFTAYASLEWMQWSKFQAGISLVKILVDLGVNPPLVEAVLPSDNFHDTIVPRLGAEFTSGDFTLRAGYAYYATPAPQQTGISTLMDNNRHIIAGGMSVKFKGPSFWPWPGRLHLSYQLHLLEDRLEEKVNPTLTNIRHGGNIHHVSAGISMDF